MTFGQLYSAVGCRSHELACQGLLAPSAAAWQDDLMTDVTAFGLAHEEGLVQFLLQAAQKRAEQFMRWARRRKWTSSLAHADKFDGRWFVPVTPSDHGADAIERLLVARGARPISWVVSENESWDARDWHWPRHCGRSSAPATDRLSRVCRVGSHFSKAKVRVTVISSAEPHNPRVPRRSSAAKCHARVLAWPRL